MGEFLCSLIAKPRLQEFAIYELMSLASLFRVSAKEMFGYYGMDLGSDIKYSEHFSPLLEKNPFVLVRLSQEVCQKIAERAVSIERFSYFIAEGNSLDTLISNTLESCLKNPRAQEIISEDSPFAFRFDTYLSKLSQHQKESIINSFSTIPFKGKVQLKSPIRTFIVSICENSFYFSLEIAKSKQKRCSFYRKYNLPEREYLGPTTTDIELAILMVNQAQVTENSLVLDPFVGTGGILLAASVFKPLCFGGDIDMRVLKGLAVGRSTKGTHADIFTNFKNYGFRTPEIFRCDNSNPCFRGEEVFDAVVCDPPYGVRAGSRKSVKGSTEVYEGKKVFWDLLELAARVLRVGGRLVFLLPTERELYDENALPQHPWFEVVANSENVLSRKISRRLITMVKLERMRDIEEGKENSFYSDIRTSWFRKEMR